MNKFDLLKPEDFMHHDYSPPLSWFYSRVYGREISKRLPLNPSLIDESKKWVENELINPRHPHSKKYTIEWQKVLDKGIYEVIKILSSPDDDYSQVMRSTTPPPLKTIISQEERDLIIKTVKKEIIKNENQKSSPYFKIS